MKAMKLFAALATIALAATACNNRPEPTPELEQKVISVATSLYNFTKATDTAFEAGDAIGIHMVTDHTYLDNAKYATTNGTTWKGEQTNYWYKDESVTADIYAYYPYSAKGAYNVNGYDFTVNSDQTTHANYTASDLMIATANSKPTAEPVYLNFKHALSKVVVNINSELDEAIADVMLSDVYGSATVALNGATATISGSKGGIKALSVKDNQWQLIIVPQENVTPKLIVTTSAQKQYTFDIESAVSFAAGKVSTTTISLTKESISTSFTTEVTDWSADKELNFSQTTSSDVVVTRTKAVYFKPNDNWLKDGAWFAAYFWNDTEVTWERMTLDEEYNLYVCYITPNMPNVIFTRMTPNSSVLGWNDPLVEGGVLVWNQTSDLVVPDSDRSLYILADDAWSNGEGRWTLLKEYLNEIGQ